MRILVDIRHLAQPKQSGVGEYTKQLLRALFEIDQKNEYVLFSSGQRTADSGQQLCTLNAKRCTLVHVKTPNKLLNLRTIFLRHPSINWHVKEAIDLVWLPNLNIATLPPDIPTVLTMHDLSWKHFPEFYSKKMQLWHKAVRPHELVSQAAQIITPSQSTADDVHRLFDKPREQINIIGHGLDEQFHPKMEARDHGVRGRLKLPKRFALFVGTLEPRKNLIALVEAMKDYRERNHDDLHLVLAGKWGWRSHDLKRRLWKRDTKGWIHQIGYIPESDRAALYRSAEVFVWPSLYEGFGLPVLEAMACGTPVISSNTSSLPELTNGAAVLVDPYNANDISDALKGLVGSKPLQDLLRKKGLERATNYSWTRSAQRTLDVFAKTQQK